MSVNEAVSKCRESQKAVVSCQSSIAELQRKSDTLQESLPGLSREIGNAEKAKTAALDNFAMTSNKATESALKAARQAHEAAQRAYSESNELVEATARALTKRQAELARLNTEAELSKRQYWESVFNEIQASIPHEVFNEVRMLVVCGSQIGRPRQFILDSLFPNIPTEEFQEIRNELCAKYDLD